MKNSFSKGTRTHSQPPKSQQFSPLSTYKTSLISPISKMDTKRTRAKSRRTRSQNLQYILFIILYLIKGAFPLLKIFKPSSHGLSTIGAYRYTKRQTQRRPSFSRVVLCIIVAFHLRSLCRVF